MSQEPTPLLKVELGNQTMTVPAPREDINVSKNVAVVSGASVGGQTHTVEAGVKSYALLSSEEKALWAHRCAASWSVVRWSTCCIFFVTVVIVNPEETLNEGAGTEGALLLFEFVQNP